ncbi:MAG TPA: ABC transporter permease [Fimbriimonadaceae bacterium]|nr:ABC transporter permease [Fimbriimonadaceae bacterium]
MLSRFGKELGILALLVLLCVFLAAMNPRFLSPINLQNTTRLIGMYGIFSLGIAVVIVTGGIDLSVGSMIALLGVLLSIMLVERQWAPWIALPACMAIGLALGSAHGFLVTKVRLQPFIVTLCGLLLYRGLARFVAGDETKGFGSGDVGGLKELAIGNFLGVPWPLVILLILALVLGIVLHRSVYGRYLYAVGRNEEAARFSGIATKRVEAGAYVISGLLTALAAIIFAFYTNSVAPSSHGNFYELYGIAAAVLGGFSLRGGEGSIFGVLMGVALLQVLQNLVNLLGIPSSLNFAVMGAVILMGVTADSLLQRRRLA